MQPERLKYSADTLCCSRTIPTEKLKVSIGKSAEQYCEKHIGPRDVVGNKQGSLQNRLRAVLKS